MLLIANSIAAVVSALPKQNCFFLCDENTGRDCYPLLQSDQVVITIPCGEQHKTLGSCEYIWSELIKHGANRQSTLICLGGGMICDIGAFAAATFQRGMNHILLPTSLLAMVDASIGGKCGVDFKHLKNYIGLFKQPNQLIVYPKFLLTLKPEEWLNGWVEMLKHGLISDASHYEACMNYAQDLSNIDMALIEQSMTIKQDHCENDFMESGIRKRLNFGHTVGHAIESLSLQLNKPLSHGLSVAYGMLVEAYISHKIWSLSKTELDQISQDFKKFLDPLDADLCQPESLLPFMLKDKKNAKGQIMCCLLNEVGSSQENIHVSQECIAEGLGQLNHYLS